MIIKLKLNKRRILYKYLKVLNVFSEEIKTLTKLELGTLTDLDLNVLIEFLLLPERYKYSRFSKAAKAQVIKSLQEVYNWKVSVPNLNTKIYTLRDNNYLYTDLDGVLYIRKEILQMVEGLFTSGSMKLNVALTDESIQTSPSTDISK